jgi:prephenate dehydrogenase
MSNVLEGPEDHFGQPNADRDSDRLILAAADAIKKLVTDRRSLRDMLIAQERELTRLRASNAELWRHVALIRNSYRRLAGEFSRQLQGIDSAVEAATPAEFRASAQKAGVEKEGEEPI